MKQIAKWSLPRVFICVLTCSTTWAQATAQITGTVRDQAGTGLAGVSIKVTQTDKGVIQSTVSDEAGFFVLLGLVIGPYRLEAVLPGFRTYVRTGIVLQVDSSPEINVELQAGQVTDQIEVQADTPLGNTRSSTTGAVFDNEQILALPNQRSITPLITLAGASVQTGTLYIGSGLGFATEYYLDGIDHRDPYTNQSLSPPFPEAVQQFKVETSRPSAMHGEASGVSVVTKSGTNRFHGDAVEFFTSDDLNAKNYFAITESGLKRHQFGGTLGGPIKQDKLFFFAGYQGATVRVKPGGNLRSFVPTPAMLNGDWTAFTSPACNVGRAISLRAPFVNNRIDTGLYSKAAVAIANRLPKSSDPCGQVSWSPSNVRTNAAQVISNVDYRFSDDHSLFGRYLGTYRESPNPFASDNVLTTTSVGSDNFAQSYSFGDTYRFGANTMNSFRLAVNRNAAEQTASRFLVPSDVGINVYSYVPQNVALNVSGGFSVGGSDSTLRTTSYHLADDVAVVRSAHEFSFGVKLSHGRSNRNSYANSSGLYQFTGINTGLGMADFLLGQASTFTQSPPNALYMKQSGVALYGQDAWRLKRRLTLNHGLRWEPFLPQVSTNGRVYNFDFERFRQGIKSTVFKNAPAGLYFPGDPAFPGESGVNKHWLNFAPRVGLGWDVTGDGRTSVRASYSLAYDYLPLQWRINAGRVPPWGVQITLIGSSLDNPWLVYPGGNPFPLLLDQNALFPIFGSYESTPYKIHTPDLSSWNLSMQREIGTDYLVSATYLGSRTVHMWVQKPLNLAVFIPGGPCTLSRITYNPCSTTSNLNQRRSLILERPQDGQYFGILDEFDDGGTQSYNGLLLSAQRRFSRGITVNGNYTWSHCISDYADTNGFGPSAGSSYLDPNNRRFDRANCDSDRRHIFNLIAIAETPRFADLALRMLASGWRISGIYKKSSGAFLTVTSGFDQALTGVANQRPNQVLENPYADTSGRPLTRYLNSAAFALPATGTLGTMGRANIQGPGSWQFDAALSKTFAIRERQKIEARLEMYNVTNSFRPGNFDTSLNSFSFGQIVSSLDPRVMQLAVKYMF